MPLLRNLQFGDFEDGARLQVGDVAQVLPRGDGPHLRRVRPGEVDRAAHAVGERLGAGEEDYDVVEGVHVYDVDERVRRVDLSEGGVHEAAGDEEAEHVHGGGGEMDGRGRGIFSNLTLLLPLALVIYYAGQRSLLIMKEHLVNSICHEFNI